MGKKEYVCGYNHCLHSGEKVKSSEAVVIGRKHYHCDCARLKKDIMECVDLYLECINDPTQFPIVTRIINTLVFKNLVPVEYIKKNIQLSENYYKDKPVYVLYGLRKKFWEYDLK